MRLREWLAHGEAELGTGPHPDRARRDAETLLLHQTGKNKAWLMAHADDDFAGCGATGYAALLERRRRGEPIQYITGECEFYGLPFHVTPDVLIPRPETEHLVEKAIELGGVESVVSHPNRITTPATKGPSPETPGLRGLDGAPGILDVDAASGAIAPATLPGAPSSPQRARETTNPSQPSRIVDVGTGSGAIAVALAAHLPQAAITAIDISPAALAIARENADRNRLADRIRFLEGDLLAPVGGEQFEIIVSNPPYVPNTDRALIAVEVREYEPALALFAGPDSVEGLDIYRRLIPSAFDALVPGGFLLLEIGFTQSHAVEELLRSAGFESIEFTADLQGIPRVVSARRS
jgi:release factor glutamine methyltransferase